MRELYPILNIGLQDTPGTEPDLYFQLTFFYLKENKLKCQVFQVFYRKQLGKFEHHTEMFAMADEYLRIASPIRTGAPDIYDEIKSGKDKRFDDIRAQRTVKRFLFQTTPIEQITAVDAVAFCRTMIEVTSKRWGYLESNLKLNKESLVGETCDCGSLTFKGGVKWLIKENKPVRPKPTKQTKSNANKPHKTRTKK